MSVRTFVGMWQNGFPLTEEQSLYTADGSAEGAQVDGYGYAALAPDLPIVKVNTSQTIGDLLAAHPDWEEVV